MTQTQTILSSLQRGPAFREELIDALGIHHDSNLACRISNARKHLRQFEADLQIIYSFETKQYSLSRQWVSGDSNDVRSWTEFRQAPVSTQLDNMFHAVSNAYGEVNKRTKAGRIVQTVLSSIDNAKNAIELLGDVLVPA